MNFQPHDIDDLSKALARAHAEKVSMCSIDLGQLNSVLSYSPEDMTVTVQAGMILSDLQAHLAMSGQWLPLDPPITERWSIRDLIDQNPSGPRRCEAGTLRDYVIGMEVVRANGELTKSGGQVVKNVAGFDLCKLFIGAQGSLGVVTSVTFKLMPLPESEIIWKLEISDSNELEDVLRRFWKRHRNAMPAVLDFFHDEGEDRYGTLFVGYRGHHQAVEKSSCSLVAEEMGFKKYSGWQRDRCHGSLPELEYQRKFWSDRSWSLVTKESVLKSRLPALIDQLPSEISFVARMGQGSLYHHSQPLNLPKPRPHSLERRVKQLFDPNGILPNLP